MRTLRTELDAALRRLYVGFTELDAAAPGLRSQPQRQSRSAHLLSIRLDQHGLLLHAAAYVHLERKKCCGFLELEVNYVIGRKKALRSTLRNRNPEGTTKSFCAVDGVRARQSRKTADLVKIVTINQIHTT